MLVAELMVRRTWLTLTRIITQAGCSSSLPYCTICVMDHPQNMIIDGARQHLGEIVTSLRSCQLGQLSSSTCFSELTQSSGATWDPKLQKQSMGIHQLSFPHLHRIITQDHSPTIIGLTCTASQKLTMILVEWQQRKTTTIAINSRAMVPSLEIFVNIQLGHGYIFKYLVPSMEIFVNICLCLKIRNDIRLQICIPRQLKD